jgi:hypothetical protein
MIGIPAAKYRMLAKEEEERHDNAVFEIEKAKRIELGSFFGVSDEVVLGEDKNGHWGSKWDIIDKHFKKLVQDEDGKLVFSTERAGFVNQQMPVDGIVFYDGKPPTKNRYHKGFSVTFGIYQAPNGLWIGEAKNFRCPTQGHNFGTHSWFNFDTAFISQDEVFAHCVEQAVHVLTGPIEVDTDPQEIEVNCPNCEAWVKTYRDGEKCDTEIEVNTDGETGVLGAKICPMCKEEHTFDPNWPNKIDRLETPDEVNARIEQESKDRGFDAKFQPQADQFAKTLLSMVKGARQLEFAL